MSVENRLVSTSGTSDVLMEVLVFRKVQRARLKGVKMIKQGN